MPDLTYWREAAALPVIASPEKWSIGGLEKVLTASIRQCYIECLRENWGSICTTLSGGLDSSFCLAKIRQLAGNEAPIHTFTIGGSESHPDVLYARIVSDFFNTIHHEIIASKSMVRSAEKSFSSLWKEESGLPGDIAVYLVYRAIASNGFKCVIAHDGIDELLGGYWEHRKYDGNEERKARAFEDFWRRLSDEHLLPLEKKARHFKLKTIFPYLQLPVVEYISKIPVSSRTNKAVSKAPLRAIAAKYLPHEIIARSKKGFCAALDR